MIALQNQNISAHIEETNKKAEFVKKSIVNSLQIQQNDLERRRYESKKKREESRSKKISMTKKSFEGKPSPQRGKVFGSFNSISTEFDEPEFNFIELTALDEEQPSPLLPNS